MKTLPPITPTSEQLPLILNAKPGVILIRGAAGSGKTTTAILRLKQLAAFWLNRRTRLGQTDPIRVLVITFNRTLRGYIDDLAREQLKGRPDLQLTVSTFGKWSKELFPTVNILNDTTQQSQLESLSHSIPLPNDFLLHEVDYLLGRFCPSDLRDYITCRREGRRGSPRVDQSLRQRILNEIVTPYSAWKVAHNLADWNDLATRIIGLTHPPTYDVIIADESQDLSANQVRALMHCAANPSSITFVLDAAQRIYPRGFTWKEVGIEISAANSYRLSKNHRNTVEICRFAQPILQGMDIGDDGTFPDFESCQNTGTKPVVLKGRYTGQLAYAIDYLKNRVDLSTESVAFLKPRGGCWFNEIKSALNRNSLGFVEITKKDEWPRGRENIAISTMSSAKGLEFDHVIILGFNEEVTPHGTDPDDATRSQLRRLLAMAITRARQTVIVGYKPAEASKLIQYLDPDTYDEVIV